MRTQGRFLKVIAAALLAGAMSSGMAMLTTQPRAQTAAPDAALPPPSTQPPAPAPAPSPASPAPTAGSIPFTDVPYYAEWALSPHADRGAEAFHHWDKQGAVPVDCARCHSTPGFRDYLGADGSAAGVVDHPAPIGTVITCIACHNDKAMALTHVTFPSGLTVDHLGAEARCMTCHQGRESTVSVNKATAAMPDDAVNPNLSFINVHYAPAGATLFGTLARVGYEYPGRAYAGHLQHREPYTRCTTCHNVHTTEVKVEDCAACHKEVTDKRSLHLIRVSKVDYDGNGNTDEGIAQEIDHLRAQLLIAIMAYAKNVAGKPIVYNAEAHPYFFVDTNANGIADKDESKGANQYKSWTPRLLKAAYNYQFVTKDPGAFAHNPTYTIELLYDAISDLGTKVSVDLAKAKRP